MEVLLWRSSYCTGQEEIDLQHQYFTKLINRLDDDLKGPGDMNFKKNLLWELKKYQDFHFQSEENLMHKAQPSELDSHKKMHDELSAELSRKIQSFAWGPNSPDVIIAFLVDWFITHTLDEDVKFWKNQRS